MTQVRVISGSYSNDLNENINHYAFFILTYLSRRVEFLRL